MRGLALSVGLALLALWWTDPTPTTLSRYTTSLQERTPSQLHNIRQAAQSLDGVYIQPRAVFSFNQVVGPRTLERGYLPAPVFMVAETLDSVGGGICQVSSSLYNAALLAGLEVVERHPHYRPVESVPPAWMPPFGTAWPTSSCATPSLGRCACTFRSAAKISSCRCWDGDPATPSRSPHPRGAAAAGSPAFAGERLSRQQAPLPGSLCPDP